MNVFVVEHGEYEQRGIWFVADGLESAVARIKAEYWEKGTPVTWGGVDELCDGAWRLRATYTVKQVLWNRWHEYQHLDDFNITKHEIKGLP